VTAIPDEIIRAGTDVQAWFEPDNWTRSHKAAVEFRNRLLANNWPDDTAVAGRMEALPGVDPKHLLTGMRRGGMLLGVWSASRERFLYPDVQFDDDGRLIPEVSLLLQILPVQGDDAGWRRAFWLYSPHALLDGRAPSAIFAADPHRTLEVARAEFNALPDSGW
jgi:hypothetical protein